MAKIKDLRDAYVDGLKDLYHAEKQLVSALPKMVKAARTPALKEAFSGHLEETRTHVERLEQVFELCGETAKGKVCHAMKGLVAEGDEVADIESDATRDAALIGAGQKVEHYEIASYGTLIAWARELGDTEAAGLLEQTLEEEKAADEKLNGLASDVNPRANAGDAEEETEPNQGRKPTSRGAAKAPRGAAQR